MRASGRSDPDSGDRDAVRVVEPQPAQASASTRSHDPEDPGVAQEGAPAADRYPAAADEVIDVQAVARLLRVGRNTVYTLVARNQIPHRRLGKQIRFHQGAIMRWLASWSSQGAKERQ